MLKNENKGRFDIRIQRYLQRREETYNAELKAVLETIEDSASEAVSCTVKMANPYETRNGHR